MATKKPKAASASVSKRVRQGTLRRSRYDGLLDLLDPSARPRAPREYRIVNAIAKSTKDFKTGRREP